MFFKRQPADTNTTTEADSNPKVRTLVLVGHCFADRFMLKSALHRAAPDAPIETVNDAASLANVLDPSHVLLVNRVLDGRFETDSGIELIRRVAGESNGPIAMLVSNYDDAQQDAEAAGAHPGFGKNNLYEEQVVERLQAAVRVDA